MHANVFDFVSWIQDYQRFILMFCIRWHGIVFITLLTRWKMSENIHSSIRRVDIKHEQFNALTQYTSRHLDYTKVNGKWDSTKAIWKQIIRLCCSCVNTYNTQIKWYNGMLAVCMEQWNEKWKKVEKKEWKMWYERWARKWWHRTWDVDILSFGEGCKNEMNDSVAGKLFSDFASAPITFIILQ